MSVDKMTRLKIYVTITILAIIACMLVVVFIYSLIGRKDGIGTEEGNTRVLGLLNGQSEQTEILKKEERENQKAFLPILSEKMQEQIQTTVSRYLMEGKFDELDLYLQEIESKYRDKSGEDGLTMEDIAYMRADLATIINVTPHNASSMMRSFRYPEFLMAALVYNPISCKYSSMEHLDSLMVTPPPKYTLINWKILDLDGDNKSAVLHQVNDSLKIICDEVVVYKCTLYGVEFEYILGHNLQTGCWIPCVIQTQDMRAYQIFDTAFSLQSKIKKGMLAEETLDSGLIYYDINDMVEFQEKTSENQQDSLLTEQEYFTAKPIIDLTTDKVEGMFDNISPNDDYDPRELIH